MQPPNPPTPSSSSSRHRPRRGLHTMNTEAHKSTVFGIHDQYPGAHPSNVTRQLHNRRQAGVFDEQARWVYGVCFVMA